MTTKHLEFERVDLAKDYNFPLWVHEVVIREEDRKVDILEHLDHAYFNDDVRCIRITKRGNYKPWTILVIRTTQANNFKFVEYATKIATLKEAMHHCDTMLNPNIVTDEDFEASYDHYGL